MGSSRAVLPDISIRQLEYLVAVADAPAWAVAASEVGVSPSALSQGLAELERRLGVELFEAVGRRRILRASAGPLLDHARQVVALTHDVVTWAERLRTSRSGTVRLGMIDVAAVVHFPETVRMFRSERPDVELVLTVAPSGVLLDALRAGTLDVAVCVERPVPLPGVETQILLAEPLTVLAPPGAAIGEPGTWGPWVLFPESSHTRQRITAALRKLGAPLQIAAESHQPDVLLQMVRMGLGWTVLPIDTPRSGTALAPTRKRRAEQGAPSTITVGPEIVQRRLVLARRQRSVHDPAADELAERLIAGGRPSRSGTGPSARRAR